MLGNFFKTLRRPIVLIPLILIMAVLLGYRFFIRKPESASGIIRVTRGAVVQEVIVTGKTKPTESVDLGFEKIGRVARVSVAVGSQVAAGTVLITLDQSELSADLAETQAEVRVRQAKLKNAELAWEDAGRGMLDTLRDAYTKADDAVRNRVDQFFSSPRSNNPQLNVTTDTTLENSLETERLFIESMLVSWQALLAGFTPASDLEPATNTGKENLTRLAAFLNQIALALNTLRPNSTVTQANIDTWRSDVATGRTNVNTAISNLSTAEEKLRRAPGDIAAEQAEVASAEARVNSIRAQLAKTVLWAPFGGVITKQEARVGEIVAANTPLVSIISRHGLEIEVNIPEVDIGKVGVGNPVRITFDALPDESFSGKVVAIDPAETIIEGVVNFKATILFGKTDPRFKSGLTANLAIETLRKSNVLVVPQYALIENDQGTFVRKRENGTVKEIPVQIGIRGQDGSVEILSGLGEGDTLLNVGVKTPSSQ